MVSGGIIAVRRRRPRRRYRLHGPRAWRGVVAVAVAAAAAAAVACYPRVTVGDGVRALARVRTTSFGTRVTQIRVSWPGGAIAASARRGAVWPTGPVPAGRTVDIHAHVAAPTWLAWLPGFQSVSTWTVHTPSAPAVAHTHILRPLDHALTVSFRAPVAKWRLRARRGYGRWHHGPVRLAPDTAPGQAGRLDIQAVSRSWETSQRTVVIAWATPAYLTASVAATAASSTSPLVLQFSAPVVNARPSAWQVSPKVPGTWQALSPARFQFTPSGAGFPPDTTVTVTVPGHRRGVRGANRAYLAHTFRGRTVVAAGSVTRLQQWLAGLGYLPVTWHPTGTGAAPDSATLWNPQPGTFAWRWTTLPAALTSLWTVGVMNVITTGGLMQFQRVAGLPVTGTADGATWAALRVAWTHHERSPDGYTYILASESRPERVQLWVNGVETLTTRANTGIPATPTYLGTGTVKGRV